MKFDCVATNPPYNTGSASVDVIAGTSGDTTLYKRFIDLCYSLSQNSVAVVVQRTGIKYAVNKHNVARFNLDTSFHWQYTAGYFIANNHNQAEDITADTIIRKTYSIKQTRPFRTPPSGSYKKLKQMGKFVQTPASQYGLVDTPNATAPAVYDYITGSFIPPGPKLVFKGLESRYSYTVTELPHYVGSGCTLFFDTIEQAEAARLFILNNPIVKYLKNKLNERARGLVFRHVKLFDLAQIETGMEIPREFMLTPEEIAQL